MSPSMIRTAAVAPMNACSRPMPLAGVRTTSSGAQAPWPLAASPLVACAARRAAAIRSDLPPRSGMTDSLAPPAAPSDRKTGEADAVGSRSRAELEPASASSCAVVGARGLLESVAAPTEARFTVAGVGPSGAIGCFGDAGAADANCVTSAASVEASGAGANSPRMLVSIRANSQPRALRHQG
jgi:hypothetical protein